jgi:hypothetical protein
MKITEIRTEGASTPKFIRPTIEMDNGYQVMLGFTSVDDIDAVFAAQSVEYGEDVPDLKELKTLAIKTFSNGYVGNEILDKRPEPEKQKTRKVIAPFKRIEIIDGKAVLKTGTEEIDELIFNEIPVENENGEVIEGLTHKIPVMA